LQLRRTTRERDRADRIAAFTTGMFKVSEHSVARGNSITAREILDKASKDIDCWAVQRSGAAGTDDADHGRRV
jgi:non-specific serine/threonine protein kinase/serine/threonine-protein kinase